MRIVYEIERLSTTGGIEHIISEKASFMAEEWGWDITILVIYKGCEKPFYPLSPKVKVKCLNIISLNNIITVPLALYRLNKEVKRINPDIYITFQHIGAVSCMLNTHRIKTIYEAHVAKTKMIHPFAIKIAEKYANVIVSLTHKDAMCYNRAKKVVVIPNFSTLKPNSLPNYNSHIAVSLGRNCFQKDFPRLKKLWSKAAKNFPDWQLNIHHTTKDVIKAYTSGSIYLMTSRFEGFGLVLLEAMQCGLPCIAFDCPCGPSDIIEDEITGFLIPYNNDALFIEKLTYLMEHPEIRQRMGEAAIKSAKRFDKNIIMNQWKELLTTL